MTQVHKYYGLLFLGFVLWPVELVGKKQISGVPKYIMRVSRAGRYRRACFVANGDIKSRMKQGSCTKRGTAMWKW